jgi:2-C-methyl-D-erythritol 2,4-cyclodiphosphate synthase
MADILSRKSDETTDKSGGNPQVSFEYASTIGQDSHRFLSDGAWSGHLRRPLILGGVIIDGERPLSGNSDADVLLHALINAISGLTGINILGERTDELCLKQGITDSSVYLAEALATLGAWQISHLSFSIEGKKPLLAGWIPKIKQKVAQLCGMLAGDIGMTATSGEGLTDFGRGEGLQVLCLLTARRKLSP